MWKSIPLRYGNNNGHNNFTRNISCVIRCFVKEYVITVFYRKGVNF